LLLAPLGLVVLGMLSGMGVFAVRRYLARVEAAEAAEAARRAAASAAVPGQRVFDGSMIDLSSVMGRARKLANAWDQDAALLGIEATLQSGMIQPSVGGSAKLTFGPSPFAPTPRRTGLFVVTYDQSGLHAADAPGLPSATLPEPMCAPEAVLLRVAEFGVRPLLLRYGVDSEERPSWLVSPLAEPERLRIFEPQSCGPRGTIVVKPKR
jgi:hypothetical protein